ncbi:hypothetical protein [Acidisoma sp.]|uniref:hypothetical protein n=1 Tax=Acidisoma sp. TaxID=1872115 RepID=UPI003B0097BD
MIAKKAAASPSGRATSVTKTRAVARALVSGAVAKDKAVQPAPEQADNFSDVMKTLDQVRVKNDELTVRINRLVTSLQ